MLISASQIIVQSFNLYKKNWKLLGKYALFLLIPLLVLTLPGLVVITKFLNSIYGLGLYIILTIAVSLFSILISIALTKTIAELYSKSSETKNVKENLRLSVSLIIPTVLAAILSGLIILGGIILFIIPGIIFSIWYSFIFYSVVLDNKKNMEALRTSKSLVKGRWWGVWWRLFAPAIIFALIQLIISWILKIPFAIFKTVGGNIAILIISLLSTLATVLFLPLTTAAPTILYLELKKTPLEEVPAITPSIQQ